MALKRRFLRKQEVPKGIRVVVDNGPYLPQRTDKPRPGTKDLSPLESSKIPENQSELQKRVSTYRRINELYQDKGIDFLNLLKGFLEIIVKTMQSEGGSLWLRDIETRKIECKGAIGPGSKEILGFSLPEGKGIVGWVISKNASTLVYDTATDDRFSGKGDQKTRQTTRSLIACPLYYAGEVLGAIEVVNKKTSDAKFVDSDKIFLEDICTPAAMHIQTTLSRKKQETLLQRMQTFGELHTLFASTLEIDQLLSMVLTRAISLLYAEVGSIWLTDETGERIICHVAEGPTKSKVIGVKLNKGAGIIGSVVDSQKPSIVEDCSKDVRFSAEVDKKTGFTTRTMLTAPLNITGECIGAIQIINKKGDQLYFTKEDMDLLMLFASSSALYLKNARLFASHKKAKELSALIGISKEITATLDLDAVLMSIVNLSSDVIPYDLASISIERAGNQGYEVRGISNQEKVDTTDPQTKSLEVLHQALLKQGKEICVSSGDDYSKKNDFLSELNDYLKSKKLQSFWCNLLKDDQGILGLLTMESEAKNMISEEKKELLSLLVNQSTVALRNAQLYQTIPTGNIFTNFKQKWFRQIEKVKNWPRERQIKLAVSVLGVFFALIFVKVPNNISTNVEVIPMSFIHFAHSQGVVDQVFVKEGQEVKTGDVLLRLDQTDLIIDRKKKESLREKVIAEMIRAQGEDKIGEAKIKEKEKISLESEIELLKHQIKKTDLMSIGDGVVVSEKLDELLGKPVSFGQELVKVAQREAVYVQFQIPEEEILFIQPGQKVKFKVFGLPSFSFSKDLVLETIAGEAKGLTEKEAARFFIARAQVPMSLQAQALLRPGMTGRGKIYAQWQSLGFYIFYKPLRFLMMKLF